MGWFKKKADPITDRARALNDQIAALESQIKQLSSKAGQEEQEPGQQSPRMRSTALPGGATTTPPPAPQSAPHEPIFEEINQKRLKDRVEPPSTPEHYNELGVRKYDVAALVRRIKNHFRGPSTANPKLVSYLAAGSIQGLRPMRYEKRVARNRVIIFSLLLFLLLLGIIMMFVHR